MYFKLTDAPQVSLHYRIEEARKRMVNGIHRIKMFYKLLNIKQYFIASHNSPRGEEGKDYATFDRINEANPFWSTFRCKFQKYEV